MSGQAISIPIAPTVSRPAMTSSQIRRYRNPARALPVASAPQPNTQTPRNSAEATNTRI